MPRPSLHSVFPVLTLRPGVAPIPKRMCTTERKAQDHIETCRLHKRDEA